MEGLSCFELVSVSLNRQCEQLKLFCERKHCSEQCQQGVSLGLSAYALEPPYVDASRGNGGGFKRFHVRSLN